MVTCKRLLAAAAFGAVACQVGCGWLGNGPPSSPTSKAVEELPSPSAPSPSVAQSVPVTLVGAGDIAVCGAPSTEATARLLDGLPGAIFTAGDNAYPNGAAEYFATCYEPTWGRHRARTYPAPGNHEYEVAAAAPYFAYFGAAAGPAGLGYYSYDLGAWHILSLNSSVAANPGSSQYEWVRNDLAANPRACTMAYWHHPLFSSGLHGNQGMMRELWRLLDQAGVDLVVVGHDHGYERFAPQDADGRLDPRGIREFVAGTGGAPLYRTKTIQPNSEVRENQTWGVLKLALRGTGYEWEFVPIEGQSFRDFGSADCVQ